MSAPNTIKKHHKKEEFCSTRAKYREGRQPKGVKVYTVSQESRYLLVQGVPALGAQQELVKVFALYGAIEEYRLLDEYPAEEFTEVFWFKYKTIQSARVAKRKLDDYSFFGGNLHVCYAPEFESVQDTREKLQDRRKAVAKRIRQLDAETSSKRPSGAASSSAATSTIQQSEGGRDGQPHAHRFNRPATVSTFQSQNTDQGLKTASDPDELTKTNEPCQGDGTVVPLALPPPPQVLPPWEQQYTGCIRKHHPPIRFQPPHYGGLPPQSVRHGQRFPPIPPRRPFQGEGPWNPRSQWIPGPPNFRPRAPHHAPNHTNNSDISGTDPSSHERTIDGLTVRDHKAKSKNPPKFVPRQLTKKHQTLKRLRSDTETEEPAVKQSKEEDSMNSELKRNAFVLGNIKGPTLPEQDETRRQVFLQSEMGDVSLEQTMMKIRQKVREFSAKALPPQVLKKLKRT